MKMVKWLR
jgi:hypothetical protein